MGHHLTRVLRLTPGAHVELYDGSGQTALATLVDTGPPAVVEQNEGPISAPPRPPLYALLGHTKGAALDRALRMATEAGATHLWVVGCTRSVPRGTKLPRWERIVAAAARQCGRADVPTLAYHPSVRAGCEALPSPVTDRFVAHPGAAGHGTPIGGAAVLVGPEGGLTEDELRTALEQGLRPLGLGPHVLRADTAAAAAVSALSTRQADDDG